jgi:hypothetical protein
VTIVDDRLVANQIDAGVVPCRRSYSRTLGALAEGVARKRHGSGGPQQGAQGGSVRRKRGGDLQDICVKEQEAAGACRDLPSSGSEVRVLPGALAEPRCSWSRLAGRFMEEMVSFLRSPRGRLTATALVAYVGFWIAWRTGLWWSPDGPHNRAEWFALGTLVAAVSCGGLIRHPAALLLGLVPLALAIGLEESDGVSAAVWVIYFYVVPSTVALTVGLVLGAVVSAVTRRGPRPPTLTYRCPRCGRPLSEDATRCRACLLDLATAGR